MNTKFQFDNDTIREAVKLHYNDKESCIAKYGPIEEWDVSKVTDMSGLFRGHSYFNHDISKWDVSKVTDMSFMFLFCHEFNQNINKWNVSNVTNMTAMFGWCYYFDQELNDWNVSNVTDMECMFEFCRRFKQKLNKWNVTNTTSIRCIFLGCQEQDLSSWKIEGYSIEGIYGNEQGNELFDEKKLPGSKIKATRWW